jgi:predicted acyl esterase
MNFPRLLQVNLLILATATALHAQPGDPEEIVLGDVVETHLMIPMRDGAKLSAYLYRPKAEKEALPVVFEQRYGSLRGLTTREAAARIARARFAVVLVNFRGTHLSEGKWVGYRALQWGELQDGYDVCEWLAQQPWSSGKVGTFGSSQGGYAQNYLAVTQPPSLVCQYMTDTGLSLYEEGYRIGGTTRPQRFKGMDRICRDPADNRALLDEWFRHPTKDKYWLDEDCSQHFPKMNVPCFTVGSWYDFMNQGSIASFVGRQHEGGPQSRNQQQLLIGPWLHGRLNKGNRVGELVYPENATWPVEEHMVRWFNHYLRGEGNAIEQDSTVRYYVMGALGEPDAPGNVWRAAKDFPPQSTETAMYLSTNTLSPAAPMATEGQTSFESDPRKPMEIPGTGFPGARDAGAFEAQSEVLTFTTPVLDKPVEWTGRVYAELFVSSTALDTDVIVRVSDVYPDGRSILIVGYPRRMRYRDGFEQEKLMEPNKIYKVRFPVGWLSQNFNAGHRIRVTIASTGAPFYEPNPQNGKPMTIEFPDDASSAVNTVYHNKEYASRIIAPVVDLD